MRDSTARLLAGLGIGLGVIFIGVKVAGGGPSKPATLDVKPGDLIQASFIAGGLHIDGKMRVTQVNADGQSVMAVLDPSDPIYQTFAGMGSGPPGPVNVPRANISQIIQRA